VTVIEASVVRPVEHLQRAHDLLQLVAREDVETPKDIDDPLLLVQIMTAVDVLCWVLQHKNQAEFGKLLYAVEMALKEAGHDLSKFETPEYWPTTQ